MLEIYAPAKINLTLDVLCLRDDGYHEVETVMQSLELCDRILLFKKSGDITIEIDHPKVPGGEENLAYRAAVLLKKHTGHKGGVHIRLYKKIPVAAGLGGGSSDAAAVLKGLNLLWDLGMSLDEMLSLGRRLGADVPFCIKGGTAYASGKGDLLTTLPELPRISVVLVKPAFGVLTPTVYRVYDEMEFDSEPATREMVNAIKSARVTEIPALINNMLEPVVMSMHPRLMTIKEKLIKAGALGAQVSGSGPALFGLFFDQDKAYSAIKHFRGSDEDVILTCFGRSDSVGVF